ncbi:aromatic acid exporter family protein [Ectobacillus sp. SYSU M60031]|uniref:Aromatic acid exporter family protein n=2 Tax=Ectobacillus ponti TaxID=2961894 RepID=A0AA42BMM9_9BACI|nr:aromatic acid exporter family protein [Ectobacillus ponti]
MKTAAGAAAAIYIAQLLGLQFYSSAGILVILCVQNTKKKSLEVSFQRFAACVLAMLFCFVLFEGLAYHAAVIGLLLLLYIPVAVALRLQEGIVTSSVIVMHIYSLQHISWGIVWNEILILAVGIAVALLVNLHMPDEEGELRRYQQQVEESFKVILHELTVYLRQRESQWDGKELLETPRLLEEAGALSSRRLENHLMYADDYYYRYFAMRVRQFGILERMVPLVASLSWTYEQAGMIADFIESVGRSVRPENTAVILLRELQEMRQRLSATGLPQTRGEFEARAMLLQLVNEMERFLLIKSRFIGKATHTT